MADSLLNGVEDQPETDEHLADELIITRVADYDVLRVLGRGGMGVVCRARDRLLGREVALKLMHSGVLASDEELRRFRTEAEAVARLRHPNIISIYETGEADGQAYYTMTLADGGTLHDRLDRGPLPAREAVELIECIARAVQHAHQRGVLHRDLKPANILFDTDARPIVSDFGLARFTGADTLTRSGSLVGTPAYLAPEVAAGTASHTTSSDIYALGIMLYECLAGHPPFQHDSPLQLLKLITENDPPRLTSRVGGVDHDLQAIVLRALAKEPAARYSNAEDFADDLARWLHGEPVTARHPPPSERFWRWAQRNQSRAVLYVMAAVSLIILVIASAVMNLLLARAQADTATAMERSEMNRARLLRDHAATLMQIGNDNTKAVLALREARRLTTGIPIQDEAIDLRLRVLDRLDQSRHLPFVRWTGENILQAWIGSNDLPFVRLADGSRQLTPDGLRDLPDQPTPPALPDLASTGVTADSDNVVHVWLDQLAAKELTDPMPHPAIVRCMTLSPDVHYLATIADDRKLRIWEIATALQVSPPLPVDDAASRIAWSPQKHQIIVWSRRSATWYDW